MVGVGLPQQILKIFGTDGKEDTAIRSVRGGFEIHGLNQEWRNTCIVSVFFETGPAPPLLQRDLSTQ